MYIASYVFVVSTVKVVVSRTLPCSLIVRVLSAQLLFCDWPTEIYNVFWLAGSKHAMPSYMIDLDDNVMRKSKDLGLYIVCKSGEDSK